MRKLGPLLALFGGTVVVISIIWLAAGPAADDQAWIVARNQMKLMIGVGLVTLAAGAIMFRIAKRNDTRRDLEAKDPE